MESCSITYFSIVAGPGTWSPTNWAAKASCPDHLDKGRPMPHPRLFATHAAVAYLLEQLVEKAFGGTGTPSAGRQLLGLDSLHDLVPVERSRPIHQDHIHIDGVGIGVFEKAEHWQRCSFPLDQFRKVALERYDDELPTKRPGRAARADVRPSDQIT
ncbi:hypothetical protein AK812_SmicGene39283 [Symbiodinium microadriaticum]|uniref:Uncharacterized protein n=1 Tax=Symbiodinium microadriaticum TaxID=2951 RepID=A0A1Q9CBL3_SYMMI|nr:hypothetical protein AK812_SmicGene39283 [Symbiodinium microadriaticum]